MLIKLNDFIYTHSLHDLHNMPSTTWNYKTLQNTCVILIYEANAIKKHVNCKRTSRCVTSHM